MFHAELLILMFIVFERVHSKNLECYQCKNHFVGDDLREIRSCDGFQPNSTYKIKCQSEEADVCLTVFGRSEGAWKIEERSCGGYVMDDQTDAVLVVSYSTSTMKNAVVDKLKKNGFDPMSGNLIPPYYRKSFCHVRNSLKTNRTKYCPCTSDLCNGLEISLGNFNESVPAQVTAVRKKCYTCNDDPEIQKMNSILPCKGFQPNSTYQKECEGAEATVCMSSVTFTGSTWETRERGCGGLAELNDKPKFKPLYTNGNTTNVKWFQNSKGLDDFRFTSSCSSFLRYSEKDNKTSFCFCGSDLCNDGPEILIDEPYQKNKLKCYGCSNRPGKLPCSGFEANATYEIRCKGENTRFCSTTMETDGSKWTVAERDCASLMTLKNRVTLVPSSEKLEGYENMSDKFLRIHGSAQYCVPMKNPSKQGFYHACDSDLCNAGIPYRYSKTSEVR